MVVDADADLDAAADAGGVGRDGQRRPDLPGRRAGVRGRPGLRPVPGQAGRAGRPRPARRRPRRRLRAHHPARASSRSSSGTCDDAFARGARALVGGRDAVRPPYVDPVVLVDVPADALVLRRRPSARSSPVEQGPRRRPGRRPGQRQPLRPGGAAVFAGRRADRIARALRSRHDQRQLGPDLRRHAVAALRRGGGVRLRPHPRPRRPARVRPLQGHHPPALPPALPDAELRPAAATSSRPSSRP